MNILIYANHYAVASGRYCFDALRRLGHNVYSVGLEHGGYIWGLKLPRGFEWKCTLPPDDVKIDAVLVMDSDPQVLDQSAELGAQLGAPVVVYGVDNHVRDYRRPHIQHYFLAHQGVTLQPFSDCTTWLPCAYDPYLMRASGIPWQARAYDVVLLGVLYDHRRALVDKLRRAGLKVFAGTGLVYESYVAAHHNARISLCLSARGDVGQRVFESAAMGCTVVSDPCKDFAALGMPGVWEIESDAVEEIRAILADPDKAREEAQKAQAWAFQHTWDKRCMKIVEWLEKNT